MIYAPYEKTPPEAVEDIKKYLVGKTIYDLGCGDGEFSLAMSKYGKVIGIEADPFLVVSAKDKGVETITEDYLNINYPCGSVLFIFMSFYGTMRLATKLKKEKWHGTIISHYYPLHEDISNPWSGYFINISCPLHIYEI